MSAAFVQPSVKAEGAGAVRALPTAERVREPPALPAAGRVMLNGICAACGKPKRRARPRLCVPCSALDAARHALALGEVRAPVRPAS